MKAVKEAAAKHRCVILLKGRVDIISDGKKVALNRTGNSGMTVGGTGDVLAGICAGFMGLGLSPFNAACAAAFVNGTIGDKLLRKMSYGFLASDFVKEIPVQVKRIMK